MGLDGKLGPGSATVLVGGQPAARQQDETEHKGRVSGGSKTVTIGPGSKLAARVGDKFLCSGTDPKPHVGGLILPPGCPTVLIEGKPAARQGDATLCLGPGGISGGGGGGGDGSPEEVKAKCAALWNKYLDEAKAIIAPAGSDHQLRNKIISGAYSKLYLSEPCFVWAGLAGYASKQVGCALETAKGLRTAGYGVAGVGVGVGVTAPAGAAVGAATRASAGYMFNMLGEGNRDLFLDVYPLHRFYQEQGAAKMAECAGAREPPVSPEALQGFMAIDDYKRTGDKKYLRESLNQIAQHEQVNILQPAIYDDWRMRRMLRINQTGIPLITSPAKLVLGPGCEARKGDVVSIFDDGKRTRLYDIPERMDWIGKTADGYMKDEGSARMKDDLGQIEREGRKAGGTYP